MAFALLCTSAAAPADSGVATSLLLGRTRFLSTEKAVATLTIDNETTQTILFSWDEMFLVRAGPRWIEEGGVKTITHVRAPTEIPALSRFTALLDLPSCTVYSDPCFQDVIAEYAITSRGAATRYQTRLPRYEFVPDPTATYDVPGLTGNRVAFIVPGVAHDTIVPETEVIQFTPSPPMSLSPFAETPALVSQLAEALRNAGVKIGATGFDTGGDAWTAKVYVPNATDQQEVIARAIAQIKETFRTRIASVDRHMVFDPLSLYDPVDNAHNAFDRAHGTARQLARQLAALSGSSDILPNGPSLSVPRVYLGNADDTQIPDLDHPVSMLDPTFLAQAAGTPTPIQVLVEDVFTGRRPASWDENAAIAKRAAAAFRSPDYTLPPIDPQAVMAADRAEIYVTGSASVQASLRRGLAPYFVAALDAREKTRYIAHILGVQPGPESLLAVYPMDSASDSSALGVATTFAGDPRSWLDASPDPRIKTYSVDNPSERAMVPITIPDESTTIAQMAEATSTLPPDALRLDVQFVAQTPESVTASPAVARNAVRRLKRLSYVMNVAVDPDTTDSNNAHSPIYEVLLKGAEARELRGALAALRSFYAPLHPSVQFRVDAVSLKCKELEDRLLEATIRQNWLHAQAEATTTHRRIRKLLLFATDEQDFCTVRDRHPITFTGSWPRNALEIPPSTDISATSMTVFRTFAAKAPR